MASHSKTGSIGEEAFHAVEAFGEEVFRGMRRLSRLQFPMKQSRTPLKRSMSGFETEHWVLDGRGKVTNADPLIAAAKKRGIPVAAESTHNQIEVLCLPHHHHRSTSLRLANNLLELSELADKQGLRLYPYATYPGKMEISQRQKPRYQALRQVYGKNFDSGLLCCGYHQHYTLPRGLFDHKRLKLKYTPNSKVRRTLLDSYNFLIAADPALTCLLQSSPFVQGRYLAKDSRLLLYRDGSPFQYKQAMFARHPLLGRLPPYEHTMHDLIQELKARHTTWKGALTSLKLKGKEKLMQKGKELSYYWGPTKINPKGTLEYRGTDINLLSNVLGVSTMIKFALRRIQQDFLLVTPTDMRMRDAFKTEGNLLFIPPQSVVRGELQHASAYEGFKNKRLHTYLTCLFRFVKDEVQRFDPDYLPLLKPVQRIIDNKRTISDELIMRAKRNGQGERLTSSFAQELAVKESERFTIDLHKAVSVLMKVYE